MWFCVLFVALAFASPITVDPDTHMFVDAHGRERFFHGLNVVQKKFPWYPLYTEFNVNTSFSLTDIQEWQSWGMNVVRLSCQWPGFEPEQGQLNTTYLETLKEIVDMAYDYGIYTLLDFHQDDLSEKFCGEGLPNWATKTLDGLFGLPAPVEWPWDLGLDDLPSKEQCNRHFWGDYSNTLSGSYGYQALYDNVDGIQDALGYFWRNVTEIFKDSDAVLGYEFFNEPNRGFYWGNPLRWYISGYTDYHHLQPMYDRLQKMVREIDTEHLIFFEPVPADSSAEQTGFTEVPGGEAYQNRSVLSFHYYDPPNHPMPVHFNSRKDDMDRLHTGGMLTEFNCASINVTQPGGKWTSGLGSTNTMVETTDLCDDHLLSWIGWEYKPYYPITGASYSVWRPDGSINSEFLATLARTYPTEVAGRTQGFSFNNSTAEFWLNYTTTPASSLQNSTVYLHELYHYPNGYEMEFLNNNEHLFKVSKPMTNYISLAPAGEVPEGTEINIRITRK